MRVGQADGGDDRGCRGQRPGADGDGCLLRVPSRPARARRAGPAASPRLPSSPPGQATPGTIRPRRRSRRRAPPVQRSRRAARTRPAPRPSRAGPATGATRPPTRSRWTHPRAPRPRSRCATAGVRARRRPGPACRSRPSPCRQPRVGVRHGDTGQAPGARGLLEPTGGSDDADRQRRRRRGQRGRQGSGQHRATTGRGEATDTSHDEPDPCDHRHRGFGGQVEGGHPAHGQCGQAAGRRGDPTIGPATRHQAAAATRPASTGRATPTPSLPARTIAALARRDGQPDAPGRDERPTPTRRRRRAATTGRPPARWRRGPRPAAPSSGSRRRSRGRPARRRPASPPWHPWAAIGHRRVCRPRATSVAPRAASAAPPASTRSPVAPYVCEAHTTVAASASASSPIAPAVSGRPRRSSRDRQRGRDAGRADEDRRTRHGGQVLPRDGGEHDCGDGQQGGTGQAEDGLGAQVRQPGTPGSSGRGSRCLQGTGGHGRGGQLLHQLAPADLQGRLVADELPVLGRPACRAGPRGRSCTGRWPAMGRGCGRPGRARGRRERSWWPWHTSMVDRPIITPSGPACHGQGTRRVGDLLPSGALLPHPGGPRRERQPAPEA